MQTIKKRTEHQESAVAEKLREARIKRQMSQHELAERCGIDRKTVNRIENEHFSPNLNTLLRLCMAMSIKPQDLFRGVR
jgi:putative transcriptional regulator